ncbi:aminotransferase-like domain-containing protein [Brumimicrobium oceani]|uniref:GntR family transcriptional regulator n=1 Tax=Brumimicrobium oceani TaxID=2100725 RepID=A0A2U2XBL4_9FLAO|nr:PLP-dependent aminotransferase family protein [Brumimicrobium oceani]PWH85153.1 GntR family transcriptional regulator [Brumimicrobium oceani]
MISITQFIRIDRRKSDSLYLQIAYQLINAVQRGLIPVGVKLPGTRVWSEELGVHRKTIVTAFEELEAQNWIVIKPKVGAFVQNPELKSVKSTQLASNLRDSTKNAKFSFNKSFILSSPFENEKSKMVCNDGQPDYRIIKTQELSRFYSGALKRRNIQSNIGNYAIQENDFFKEQLSFYLNLSRGFHISKAHLLVAKSREMLFYTLAKMLFKENDVVLVGELSFFSMNMVFAQEKVKIKTVPLEKDGIDVSYITENFKKGELRCVYLNPQQSYPSTSVLSMEKRKALIELAEEYDFVIIEDSEDFEFNYEKQVDLPMAASNSNGRIIHLGSLGKHLHPTFQLNFMMAPPDFVEEAKKHVSVLNPQGNFVLEQALGEMIAEGDFFRYQKKALKIYKERMMHFESLLKHYFGDLIQLERPKNGFAFWIEFKKQISLTQLAQELKKRDVFLPRLCMYQNKNQTALRLGFAHWNLEEMEEFVELFWEGYKEIT